MTLRTHAVLLCVSLWPMAARAQAPAPSPSPIPTHSEYVEVTATRIPEPADEVPASIEVITGEELESRGATDLRSALSLAAGVDIAPGGDSGPAASVPGFWGLTERDAFLLVVDGVPWGGAFNPSMTTLDLHDLDRIEVVRGAAPVMYGATSFVGVIQVVHKDAGTSKGRLSVTGGSYGSGAGSVSAPLPDWAGFDSSLIVDGGRQGYKDDRTSFRRGHLLWRNGRNLAGGRFRFDVDGNFLDQDPASPHLRQGPALSTLTPLDANYNPDGAFLNERRFTISTGLDRPLGSTTWSSTVSFSHSSQDIFRGFLSDAVAPVSPARGVRETIELNDLYVDSHLRWTASPRVKVVAGVDLLHGNADAKGADFDYDVDTLGRVAPRVIEPAVLDVGIDDRRDFGGLYAFSEWNPAPAWRLEAGVRLNQTIEERGGEEEANRPAGEPDAGEQTNTKLSGSVGLSWTAWQQGPDRLRLFANFRSTFKPAAIDFGIGEEEGEGEGALKPETARSYELGLKARGWDGRLSFELAAFQMDFKNLVIAQAINGLPALANAGEERFKGVEAAIGLRLANHVSARATYSFHDAKFTDFLTEFDGVPTQLAGKRLEMSARHLASAGLLYAPERGVFGSAELNWVGDRFLNKRNTALAEAYATFSASLGYRQGRWEARVDGRNLNDNRAAVSESELGDAQYYRLTARRIDVSASVRF
jgi:outer membrane receptor protein involved in Fe transport